ncbi:BTAD domain-containing putative transcriptional regulator [Actinomycetospora sp. OC33-EN08]|uniref:BTAD domain-containing putative transcriptional regulator n=1 Tax=Actinomycetospora aurantiaca TaxID=3129233 RepID=A0ABU8MVV3_9PSEU
MQLRVLGSLELLTEGEIPPLGGPKPRLLLAALLAHRRRLVPSDRLVAILWENDAPATAVATLQTHLSRLRRVLHVEPEGPRLETRPPGYRLAVGPDVVDADRFEAGVAAARLHLAGDPAAARDHVDRALAEWRGPAFAEFAAVDGIRLEAERLEELRVSARELGVDARLACGAHLELVGELEGLVAEHPLRERLWSQLMLALYRSGRPAEALRRAHQLRHLLREELGLDPTAEVRDLETGILTEAPDLDWRPPPGTAARVAAALPRGPNLLIGRTDDLRTVRARLTENRLVTVTGPGGVGKTRLAQELLPDLGIAGEHGVRWVEFAPVSGPTAAVVALATALDVQRRPGRSLEDSVVEALRTQELVLLLDNCEHVLDAITPLVDRILRWCPGVLVLATSREPLGLAGEAVTVLAPLAVPRSPATAPADARRSDAVSLFVARATAARHDFVLDEATVGATTDVCRRLDGLPLALELAAARMRSMSVAELADRLDGSFRLLGEKHAPDPRHRSLHEVIEWSHGLLTPFEQELFAYVSVFAGTFTVRRAEEVCVRAGLERADVLPGLATLVDKSMVVSQLVDGETCFRLLETLRSFARAQLDARPHAAGEAGRLAHARAHLDAAHVAADQLGGAEEADGMRTLDRAVDDLREAFEAGIALGQLDLALDLVTCAREFAFRAIRYEVCRWAESLVALPAATTRPLFPLVLGVVAYGRFVRGDLAAAVEAGRAAVRYADRAGVSTGGLAERALGNALFYRGETDAAVVAMDRMTVIAQRSADDGLIAHASYMRSVAATSVGDVEGARRFAALARAAARGCAAPTARAQADCATGLCVRREDPDRALGLLHDSAGNAASVGNRWLRAFARTEELALRAARGDVDTALWGYSDVVGTWFRGGDWANLWLSLRHVSAIFAVIGEERTSATLHGAIHAAGAATALPFEPGDADRITATAESVRVRLGEDEYGRAVATGRGMRDEDVVRMTLERLAALTGRPAPVSARDERPVRGF